MLLVTAYADTTALMKVGADWIVQKPFRAGELERMVVEAITS